jgi:hypothetical protein
MAVGFDTATQPPNTKLLVSQGWRNLLSSLPQTDSYTQIYSLSNDYCFAALLSLIGDHNAAFFLPNSQYYQQVKTSAANPNNQVIAFASTRDQCSQPASVSSTTDKF